MSISLGEKMKKLANILVKYRLAFFIISLVCALVCALLIPKVTINKDQTKYLAKDSKMSQGYEIINSEFPVVEFKDSFQIMFEGLTPTQKAAIHGELAEFDGVSSVDYDLSGVEYNSKTFSMYIVHTDYAGDGDKVSALMQEMHNKYDSTYKSCTDNKPYKEVYKLERKRNFLHITVADKTGNYAAAKVIALNHKHKCDKCEYCVNYIEYSAAKEYEREEYDSGNA
jgi:predicted RND superfamily exporter protein